METLSNEQILAVNGGCYNPHYPHHNPFEPDLWKEVIGIIYEKLFGNSQETNDIEVDML